MASKMLHTLWAPACDPVDECLFHVVTIVFEICQASVVSNINGQQ